MTETDFRLMADIKYELTRTCMGAPADNSRLSNLIARVNEATVRWQERGEADQSGLLKKARQQLQWIAMQEDKAKEFEERGEQRIPCFLQLEYVYEAAKVYKELCGTSARNVEPEAKLCQHGLDTRLECDKCGASPREGS